LDSNSEPVGSGREKKFATPRPLEKCPLVRTEVKGILEFGRLARTLRPKKK
jgi:hypothetical protein